MARRDEPKGIQISPVSEREAPWLVVFRWAVVLFFIALMAVLVLAFARWVL